MGGDLFAANGKIVLMCGARFAEASDIVSAAIIARALNAEMAKVSGLFEALAKSQLLLRAQNIGTGTTGGSCMLCGSTWLHGHEAHNEGCSIPANAAALAKASQA